MKCISIRQPFAWAILKGIKKVENRSENFPEYNGPVLIHAGKILEKIGILQDGTRVPPAADLPLGSILGAAVIRQRWDIEFLEDVAAGRIKISLTRTHSVLDLLDSPDEPLIRIPRAPGLKQDLKIMAEDPFCSGPECLLLVDSIEFEMPIPFKGQVGLFNVDEKTLALSKTDRRRLDELVRQYSPNG